MTAEQFERTVHAAHDFARHLGIPWEEFAASPMHTGQLEAIRKERRSEEARVEAREARFAEGDRRISEATEGDDSQPLDIPFEIDLSLAFSVQEETDEEREAFAREVAAIEAEIDAFRTEVGA